MWQLAKPFIRHALQFGFGLLTAKGVIDAEQAAEAVVNVETVVGAAGSLLTLASYAWDKWKASRV